MKKGFTLIELLVVIAIIGVLSSVVLASLNSARAKGSNAAVKAGLSSLRSEAAIFYDNNGQSYEGLCTSTKVVSILDNASSSGNGVKDCASDVESWSVVSGLKVAESDGSSYWCADSSGISKGISTIDDPWATSSCR